MEAIVAALSGLEIYRQKILKVIAIAMVFIAASSGLVNSGNGVANCLRSFVLNNYSYALRNDCNFTITISYCFRDRPAHSNYHQF